MSLRAEELDDTAAEAIWTMFYDLYGPEVMLDAYGWEEPRDVQPGEYVWAFYDDPEGGLVGWGSLRVDLMNEECARVAAGVFPMHQRRGIRMAILDWMSEWAKEHGIEYLITETMLTNAPQIGRKFRESIDGPWKYAGTITLPPPGYACFVRDLTEEVIEIEDGE